MIIHHDIQQGTPGWNQIRAGKFTASAAAVFVGGEKTEGLKNLIKTVAWGQVFGHADEPSFSNKSTDRGHQLEPEARDWYMFETGNIVGEVGFVDSSDFESVGWSPDGLIFESQKLIGAIEIKCLEHKAFMDVLKSREVPSVYKYQTQWAIWVGKLQWLDFVVYHPQFGGLIIRCYPDVEVHNRFIERLQTTKPLVNEWVKILTNNEHQPKEVPVTLTNENQSIQF